MLIVLYLCCFFLILAAPAQAQAQGVLFGTDFSSGELSEWRVARNQQWHHPDQPCLHDGYPAEWEVADGRAGIVISGGPSCITELVVKNLDLTPVTNFEFEFDWYFAKSTHMDRNVLLMWQDADNWYGIKVLDKKVKLQKVIQGKKANLYDNWGYYQFEPDQSYHFKLSYVENIISVWVEDELIFQTLDQTPFIVGGKTLGLQASTGAIMSSASFFDNLVVRSLDVAGEKRLNVPLYKQYDSKWKNQEYDQASTWAQRDTIQRWGCALTSATMLLNYYQIEQLPNGRQLSPATLNTWLNEQPDGYLGAGLLNWLALTRLTKLMSEELETPVLEYSYVGGNKIESAINQIQQNQPVILQLPGHFLVSDGHTASRDNLYIKDPAYDYSLLSQHESELLSTRTFQPSHTDLSYLLLAYNPEMKVTLIDESNDRLAPTDIYYEYLTNPTETNGELAKTNQPLIIQALPQPKENQYRLTVENLSSDEQPIEIYTYNTQGEVTVLSQLVTDNKSWQINFQREDNSQLSLINNKFTTLRDVLARLYRAGEIKVKYAYLKLDQLAAYAEAETDEKNQTRYQKLIEKTVYGLEQFMTQQAKLLL